MNSPKEVIWLGPYKPTDRHADDVTLNHYVELVVENQRLREDIEKYRNALGKIYWETDSPFISNIAAVALNEGKFI